MNWQQRIIHDLELTAEQSKLILDQTGILLHEGFVCFLRNSGFHVEIAFNISEVLRFLKQSECIILTSLKNLPSHLHSKIEIQNFDFYDLPLEIEMSLVSKLSVDQVILLLHFVVPKSGIVAVTSNNVQQYLFDAQQLMQQQEFQHCEAELREALKQMPEYTEVLRLGGIWGRIVYLAWKTEQLLPEELQNKLDEYTHTAIVEGAYKNAFYNTVDQFCVVSQIRSYLQKQSSQKIALICFDGMGMAEWEVLQEFLSPLKLNFQQRNIFALIPSITRISRSAIYYGNHEAVYSLNSHPKEQQEFRSAFKEKELQWIHGGNLKNSDSLLGIDMVSIIYNICDDLGHHTYFSTGTLKKDIYFENLLNALKQSSILNDLSVLLSEDFAVYFCSDHGCVLAQGDGKKIEKHLIDSYSKRSVLAESNILLENLEFEILEIPFVSNKKVVLAQGRSLFAHKGVVEISHGGITVDEIVIPFVEVSL